MDNYTATALTVQALLTSFDAQKHGSSGFSPGLLPKPLCC